MLAGVTGASAETEADADDSACLASSPSTPGGAGGGIERSTGEGVSPGISPITLALRGRAARNAGVELKLAAPRAFAPARLAPAVLALAVARIAGD